MGEKEKLNFSDSPNMTELSAEDIAALEAERKAAREAELAPAKKAADCLLYTSPSPRDKRQSRMPSSA